MYTEDRRKIYKKTIKQWGFKAQARMLQEECAELIVATSHFLRDREDGTMELVQELADVYIMVGQIIEYMGPDTVEHVVNYKLKNVEDELEKERVDGS
jgi:NTP pyrophosphatase (non-canonical NTP hydrolase)